LIEPDSYSNAITIIGRRTDIAQVESLIKRLDASALDTSVHVRIYPVSRIPAEQMAGMLQNIYPQMFRGQIRVVDKIEPHKRGATNAPTSNAPAPEAAVPANSETKAAVTNQPPAAPEVVIAIDKTANALILSGPGHELDQIERLISDLSFSFISSDAEFRQFALKEADPVVVAKTLADLFKEEPVKVQQGNEAKMVVPAPKITIVPEPRTRSVIIRAKQTDFALLESLIRQLDAEGLSSQLEFRVVPVVHAQPEKLLPLVTQMVGQLNVVRPGEPLTVAVNTRSRGLLLVGRDSVLNQLQRLIQTLDTPSEVGEAEVLIVSLKRANAAQLAVVLQTMLRPGTQGEITAEARELQEQVRRLKVQNDQGEAVTLDLSKPIKIMADPQGGGNRLLLSSTPDNLKSLEAVVAMLDNVAITEGVLVRMLPLTNADVTTVAETLTTIFQQGQRLAVGPAGPAQPDTDTGKALVNPLNVASDKRSNTLLLSGKAESLDLAEKIVKDLDKTVDKFLTEVKLFRLKHASATRLAPLLQSVFVETGSVPGSEGLNTQVTRLRTFFTPNQPRTSEHLQHPYHLGPQRHAAADRRRHQRT
jgi:type II secretory pathway component GspD/PulD (secretin)